MDSSLLQITVNEHERWRRSMSVTVPASIVRAEEQRAAQQLASRARLKGFRKGRVPARVIETRFGGALRQEALDKLINSAYREALLSQELRPINEGQIEDVRYEPDSDLSFEVAFDVEPVIELERLGGFAVERPVREIDDEQVDAVLQRVREQNGVWTPVEEGRPEERDLVSVHVTRLGEDGEGLDEGRPYEFMIGQGDALEDIETAIRSLEPGASGDFDVTFPDDFPDESRRGDVDRLRIRLESRKQLDLPELDDALAKQVGDFETLEELRARVRNDLEKEAGNQADNAVRSRILDLVLDANPFDVPDSMVDRYTEGILGDAANVPEDRLEEFRSQIRPEAERAVKRILVVDRIAVTQNLSATEDDLDARIEEIAEQNNTDASKVYAELQKSGRLEGLERDLTETAVFSFLFDQSEITDAPAS